MKKLVLVAAMAAAFTTACSKDDGPTNKCESCTSNLENEFEICDNGDGTYESTAYGITNTINKSDLGGLTPKEFVDEACAKDGCEACTSELGNEFEICDNGDGTYDITSAGVTTTISEGELEGFTPEEFVELACTFDSDPDL